MDRRYQKQNGNTLMRLYPQSYLLREAQNMKHAALAHLHWFHVGVCDSIPGN
jgi:hypothetical protein